ncbi:hypothetical protein ACFLTW_03860 [Chloroflexota bacterium]
MTAEEKRLELAARETVILRAPRQSLATFGITNIHYYLLTMPSYAELVPDDKLETVIREGRVITERPRIVTPYYMSRLDGFSDDARRYFRHMISVFGPNTPSLYYTYKNEPKSMSIVSDDMPSVVARITKDIDESGNPLASIIRGADDLWDVSLLKFIFEITRSSVGENVSQMRSKGLLGMDASGVPVEARVRIEEMFEQVRRGEREPRELKDELDRWSAFEAYEDKFFNLFRKRKFG